MHLRNCIWGWTGEDRNCWCGHQSFLAQLWCYYKKKKRNEMWTTVLVGSNVWKLVWTSFKSCSFFSTLSNSWNSGWHLQLRGPAFVDKVDRKSHTATLSCRIPAGEKMPVSKAFSRLSTQYVVCCFILFLYFFPVKSLGLWAVPAMERENLSLAMKVFISTVTVYLLSFIYFS